jgi:sortase (surface protein transpeptidase)
MVGRSLYFRMPARFVRLHNLSDGDAFYLVPGKNGITFNIAKEEVVGEQVAELVDKAVSGEELEVVNS